MMALKGKTAIITGGLGGIGFATAKCLLQSGLSNLVIVDVTKNDSKLATLQNSYESCKIIFQAVDVTDVTSVEKAFQAIFDEFGDFDILVNGAGVLDEAQPELCLKVNVLGVMNMCQVAVNFIAKQNSVHDRIIVNIASVGGLEAKGSAAIYRASKFAVVAFTRSMADRDYVKKYGLRFVNICPGRTATPMVDRLQDLLHLKPEDTNMPCQSPEECGNCILKMILSAENDSTWLFQSGKAKKVMFPSLSDCVIDI